MIILDRTRTRVSSAATVVVSAAIISPHACIHMGRDIHGCDPIPYIFLMHARTRVGVVAVVEPSDAATFASWAEVKPLAKAAAICTCMGGGR